MAEGRIIGAITGSSVREEHWAETAHGFTTHTEVQVVRTDGIGYGGTIHTTDPLSEGPRIKRKNPRYSGVTHAIGNHRTIIEATESLVEATRETATIELKDGRPYARRLRDDEPDPAA